MKRFLIVGAGGRECAFAQRLKEDAILYAVIGHENPMIVQCVKETGGKYLIGNASHPETVAEFAVLNQIDYAFISADDPLANGVVNALHAKNIKAVGGTKEVARIEWDKIYSINLVKEVCPEHTPFFHVVSDLSQLKKSIEAYEEKQIELVVKPQGLTGGKGVKVMPIHLKDFEAAYDYGKTLLEEKPKESILLVEKLEGFEFTIMGLTDGKHLALAPASYDYPYRLENDEGAGTGGMGCFTCADGKLPFLDNEDIASCKDIMQRVLDKMKSDGLDFKGVLNGGFFKTKKGIKFMEFNGRFGDPEALNVLSVFEGSFSKLIESLWHGTLSEVKVSFLKKASVIKYLVAKEYPLASKEAIDFSVDNEALRDMGIDVFYATCINTEKDRYQTLKSSRVLALGAVGESLPMVSDLINHAIEKHISGTLDYRKDIGAQKSLSKLMNIK